MKKKAWLSLLLAIAMIFPMFTTALAAPCNRPSSKLRQEYQLMGCRTEIVATTSTAEIYLLQLTDDITARVEESIMPDGAVRAIITEGELTNELLEYPDGRMYLDGSEVIFTSDLEITDELKADFSMFPDAVTPQVVHRYEIVKKCPYGNAGDYIVGSTTKDNVMIGKENTIKDLTFTAFYKVVAEILGLLSGVPAGVIETGLNNVYDMLKKQAPRSNAMGVKDYRSVHRLYGFTISSSLSVARHQSTYYYDTNYTSVIGNAYYIYYEKFTY